MIVGGAFSKLIKDTTNKRKWYDPALALTSKEVMKDMYKATANKLKSENPASALQGVKSFKEIKAVMKGRLRSSGLEVHHALPKYVQEHYLGLAKNGTPGFDDVPSILMTQFDHQGAENISNIHRLLREAGLPKPNSSGKIPKETKGDATGRGYKSTSKSIREI